MHILKLISEVVSTTLHAIEHASHFTQTLFTFELNKVMATVLSFINSILLLNQLNQVVVIASGVNSCNYIYDSSQNVIENSENGIIPARSSQILQKLEEFVTADEQLSQNLSQARVFSLLYTKGFSIGRAFVLKKDLQMGPNSYLGRYVAVMNAIFSAQRSMVPIDSCVIGSQHSAFLQQASYITAGVYLKPQHLDGLFQYLATVFATDLLSRSVLELPKPAGVDFRASCFCHKKTIDMGYICSVCLSIFCKHHKKCSTCGSVFGEAHPEVTSTPDRKRKTPMA
ncbi:General transcription and dna repair factor iih subunit tfb4 [Thalictrum thalictroides]|uniref:General transcription and DNA repair factor IIH subunit TFB4 n=1 Tax=Thalictrum thalictroides TaxID=46969 RepID=A0A7J6UZJ8_THATH|nr:General transcription and dna repair factor iih subunit tfb4 [Thalictrum thalictroides]